MLLFALAILGLLLVFGLTFARLMQIERQAAANHVDWVQAKLAAEAGLERAVAELQQEAGRRHYSDPFNDDVAKSSWGYPRCCPADHGGNPCTNTPNPAFVRACGDVSSNLRPLDLETHRYPSFWVEAPPRADGTARERFGRTLTYSGLIGAPYEQGLLVYRLKILDSASQVNLNHPDPVSANRLLKNLVRASLADVRPLTDAQAAAIADRVIPADGPAPRFATKTDLGRRLVVDLADAGAPPGISEAEWLYLVQDSISVNSWKDPSVIRPVALNGQVDTTLAPMPRAPINLNTATRAALTALFAEVRAVTRYGTFELSYDDASRLADAIRTRVSGSDGSFKTWAEFEEFVDALDASVFSGATYDSAAVSKWPGDLPFTVAGGFFDTIQTNHQAGWRDLVKAVANPNTMFSKLGLTPNHGGFERRLPRMVDKTDLTQMTTEGCLDAMGTFEITSMGLVLFEDESRNAAGTPVGYEPLAKYVKRVEVQLYKPFRLTSQADFERNRLLKAAGNFIAAPEVTNAASYSSKPAFTASVNGAVYMSGQDYAGDALPIPGWPGVVSGPEYSVDRQSDADKGYPLRKSYSPATWDGYLELTNLVTVRTSESDFVSGFARGRLDAFKARAWWEAKDLYPNFERMSDQPTRPADAAELTRLTRPLTGDPPSVESDSRSVRVRLKDDTTRASLLALGTTPTDTAQAQGEMLGGGAQLLNTGVLIAPDRGAGSSPGFVAYDSDNLDLIGGCSIRFWVQPLRDPFAQEEEVLLYFMGSNGAAPSNPKGNAREAGFKVAKVVEGGRIYIRLTTLPNDGTTHTDPAGATADYEWVANGVNTVSIDVTPEDPYGNASPEQPQWIPGSWHWIVIDIGPDDVKDSSAYRGSSVHMKVDNCDAVTNSTAAPSTTLYFKASCEAGMTPTEEFGELHGYYYDPNDGTWIEPVSQANCTSGLVRWKILPRQLGDFYHCQRTATKATASDPGNGTIDFGRGVATVIQERIYGKPPELPVLQFQGNALPWYPLYPTNITPGWYVTTTSWPKSDTTSDIPFPILGYNRKLLLRCYKTSQAGSPRAPGVEDRQLLWNGTNFTLQWPLTYSEIFGDSNQDVNPGAFTVTTTTTTTNQETGEEETTSTTTTLISSPDGTGGYPGNHEWHMALVAQWEEAHYMTSSSWNHNSSIRVGNTDSLTNLRKLLPVEYPKQPGEPYPSGYLQSPQHPELSPTWRFGETLPYAAHNSGMAAKAGPAGPLEQRGVSSTNYDGLVGVSWLPGRRPRSYIRTKVPLNVEIGGVRPIHLDYIDDDCRGCEDCDLDGPIFLGGQPTGTTNYDSAGARPADVDASTMAYAVFDNFVVLNNDPSRRSDGSTAASSDLFSDGKVNVTGAEATESRFFEEDTFEYTSSISDPNLALGAVYHRLLAELRGFRGRVGSVTWTSYPTLASNLDYGVALWRLKSTDTSVASPGIDDSNHNKPTFGGSHASGYATDAAVGVDMSTGDRSLVGGDGTEYTLVLGVRLQELRDSSGAFPSMLTESPVFEDVTINLLHDEPVYLYVEEDAEE